MDKKKSSLLILLDLALPGGEESCAAKRQMFADYLDRDMYSILIQLLEIWIAAGVIDISAGNKILTALRNP